MALQRKREESLSWSCDGQTRPYIETSEREKERERERERQRERERAGEIER